jgi:hypothetical protein
MNPTVTPPPEHDLSPATRARQRDELVAIVSHESTAAPRRHLVPLLAAASVVAVTAGLAIGVPALRHDSSQPPAAGTEEAISKPLTRPLTAAEQRIYAKRCNDNWGKDLAKFAFTVVDGFRWANPPQDSRSTAWVLIRNRVMTRSCGFSTKGQVSEIGFASSGHTQRAVIDRKGAGSGTYTKAVARITMSIGTGPATEAVLRNGFFFAPMKYVGGPRPRTPEAPVGFTVRGYDAAGKLIYQTPKTVRDYDAEQNRCYTDPAGKQVVFSMAGQNATPDQCARGVAWTW